MSELLDKKDDDWDNGAEPGGILGGELHRQRQSGVAATIVEDAVPKRVPTFVPKFPSRESSASSSQDDERAERELEEKKLIAAAKAARSERMHTEDSKR